MAGRSTTRPGNAGLRPRFRENVAGFLFLLPWLLGLLGMVAGPMATSFYLSFTETEAAGSPLWIGLENYERAFTDPRMWAAAQVTMTYVLTAVPCVVGIALALALLLNRGLSFLPVYRATFYLPSLIGGSVAIALLWRQIFGADGLLNGALSFFGIEHGVSWIGSPATALGTLVALQTWQFGSAMVIFLAGLRQIPRMYYEAASIDGASQFQQLVYVTLPSLGPLILFNTVMAMIAAFQAFNSAYIISSGSGGPAELDAFLHALYLSTGIRSFRFRLCVRPWLDPDRGHCPGDVHPDRGNQAPRSLRRGRMSYSESAVELPERGWASLSSRSVVQHPIFKHIVLVGAASVMFYPLAWMVSASFRPDVAINNYSLWPGHDFTVDNYVRAWRGFGGVSFPRILLNSFVVAALSVAGTVLSCALAAYAFARIDFAFRRALFALMLLTLMVPYHAILIPQYIMFREFGWLNTYLPLIVPRFLATDAFFVYLLTQFFRAIPRELDDAARIDGAGHLRIFTTVILPLSVPALATAAIFSFIHSWNDFFAPMVYLTRTSNFTIPLALRAVGDSSAESAFGALFAMSVLSLLPVIGIFIAFQRLLVEGIATTGMKG